MKSSNKTLELTDLRFFLNICNVKNTNVLEHTACTSGMAKVTSRDNMSKRMYGFIDSHNHTRSKSSVLNIKFSSTCQARVRRASLICQATLFQLNVG